MPDVFDRGEQGLNFGEQDLIDRFGGPGGPVADVLGVGAAGDRDRDRGVGDAELDRQLGKIAASRLAEFRGGAAGRFDGLGLFVPGGQLGIGEQPGGERASIHRPDATAGQQGKQLVGEAGVLQGVLVVAEDDIEIGLLKDEAEQLHRIARDADESHLARLLEFAERGKRFVDNLLHGDELDVVAETDIEVVGPEPVETDIDAFGHAFGAEVEMGQVVAAELGAEEIVVSGDIAKGDAEEDFAHASAVEGRGVDEIEPDVESDADAAQRFIEGNWAELLTQG